MSGSSFLYPPPSALHITLFCGFPFFCSIFAGTPGCCFMFEGRGEDMADGDRFMASSKVLGEETAERGA